MFIANEQNKPLPPPLFLTKSTKYQQKWGLCLESYMLVHNDNRPWGCILPLFLASVAPSSSSAPFSRSHQCWGCSASGIIEISWTSFFFPDANLREKKDFSDFSWKTDSVTYVEFYHYINSGLFPRELLSIISTPLTILTPSRTNIRSWLSEATHHKIIGL